MSLMSLLLAACGVVGGDPAGYTGTIEVTEVEVASTLGGRIAEVLPKEGDAVKVGDPLVRLDADMLQAELALRAAGVEQADAARQAGEAQVRAVSAQVALLERELQRANTMRRNGVGTDQQISQLTGQLDVARAQAAAAREQVHQAEAAVRQAQAALQAAETHLDDAVVHATVDGVVLSRNREPGEVVGPGMSVLTVGDLGHPRLRIYVALEDVERLEIGASLPVTLDSGTTSGVVERIAKEAEFTPREILTPDERVKRVFAVDLALQPGPGVHPGMPADVVLAR
ncbi:MAG: HlyD family efflux transporter periplasmic adaptor subunit [Alphaproteobacteria bacterium]|nr:HlyD family efflux transporter periplasmic adaptor subunit [Alphaproteobacteria bacterium]